MHEPYSADGKTCDECGKPLDSQLRHTPAQAEAEAEADWERRNMIDIDPARYAE
jgi:hypothetical protein